MNSWSRVMWGGVGVLVLLSVIAIFIRYIVWEDFAYDAIPVEQFEAEEA